MTTSYRPIRSLDELRRYVNEILCEHCELKIGAFVMTEKVLKRGSKPCGIFFCLHGPRAVKFTAIWEMDRNRILFYGSGGQRFENVQLTEAPHLDCVAA